MPNSYKNVCLWHTKLQISALNGAYQNFHIRKLRLKSFIIQNAERQEDSKLLIVTNTNDWRLYYEEKIGIIALHGAAGNGFNGMRRG